MRDNNKKKLCVNEEYCVKVLQTIFVQQNTKLVFILIKKKEGLQNESKSGKDIISTFISINFAQYCVAPSSCFFYILVYGWNGRRDGLMVSALIPGASGLGSSPGRDTVVFLGEALNSHGASLHPGV